MTTEETPLERLQRVAIDYARMVQSYRNAYIRAERLTPGSRRDRADELRRRAQRRLRDATAELMKAADNYAIPDWLRASSEERAAFAAPTASLDQLLGRRPGEVRQPIKSSGTDIRFFGRPDSDIEVLRGEQSIGRLRWGTGACAGWYFVPGSPEHVDAEFDNPRQRVASLESSMETVFASTRVLMRTLGI